MSKKSKPSKSSKKTADNARHNNPAVLPGWPGYRTRAGRTGYDPIDSRTEAAHTLGIFIQRLFTGQVRNPVTLVLLGVMGLILVSPLALAISEALRGNVFPWSSWLIILLTGIAGVAILINFVKNLVRFFSSASARKG